MVFGFEKHVCVLFKYRYLDHRSIICTVWCIKHGLLTTFPKKKLCDELTLKAFSYSTSLFKGISWYARQRGCSRSGWPSGNIMSLMSESAKKRKEKIELMYSLNNPL